MCKRPGVTWSGVGEGVSVDRTDLEFTVDGTMAGTESGVVGTAVAAGADDGEDFMVGGVVALVVVAVGLPLARPRRQGRRGDARVRLAHGEDPDSGGGAPLRSLRQAFYVLSALWREKSKTSRSQREICLLEPLPRPFLLA